MAESYGATGSHGTEPSNPTEARNASWTSLPAEIRLMILEAIARQKHQSCASLATVCQEWQFFFEKQNFRRLRIGTFCLHEFQRICVQRRELIHHIQLDPELCVYTCPFCGFLELGSWVLPGDDLAVVRGFQRLFSILSSWKLKDALTLEISSRHNFGVLDLYPQGNRGIYCCNPGHAQLEEQGLARPPWDSILRPIEPINMPSPEDLPRVEAVTCFAVSRKVNRQLRPKTLRLILGRLCHLEHVWLESWQLPQKVNVVESEVLSLLQTHLPGTLRRLSLWQDFDDNISMALSSPQSFWGRGVATRHFDSPRIDAAFASRSLDLEELSVSYLVDAEGFFQACEQVWVWQRLRFLALTSQVLHETTSRQRLDDLLCSAGRAALQMPRLQTLVLWNRIPREACAFIYHAERDCAYLSWRGMWDPELSPRVVDQWQHVASDSCRSELLVDTQQMRQVVEAYGRVKFHLDLPYRMAPPASIRETRRRAA